MGFKPFVKVQLTAEHAGIAEIIKIITCLYLSIFVTNIPLFQLPGEAKFLF